MTALQFSDEPLTAGTRVAARVEYNGMYFNGWQAQPHLDLPTVQEALEAALSSIAIDSVQTVCAGRTDTGVHGFGQIIHFDDPTGRSPKAWVMGVNSQLPRSIRLHWAQAVDSEFHARFTALDRHYRYIIANSTVRPALLDGLVTWYRRPLDAERMNEAAKSLLGERDFSAFRAASCQSNTPWRCVSQCAVERLGDHVVVDIRANAFLHHMVRNIVGSLILIGTGMRPVEWLSELLETKDRNQAADTAPSDGLYLAAVAYPDRYELPATPLGPSLLSRLI